MSGIDAYSQACLHMEGLDNGTTFVDSSPLPNTVTPYGVKTKTAVKVFGSASAYFDGASYLALDDINNWVLRSTWTVDFRARFDAAGGNQTLYSVCAGVATDRYNLRHYTDTGVDYLEFYAVSGGVPLMLFKAPWSPTPGQFYHIAVCRTPTDLTIYVDGAALTPGPTYTCSATPMPKIEAPLWLGKTNWTGNYRYFAGYIDEFRFSNNIARYSGPFTVPPAAYTEGEVVAPRVADAICTGLRAVTVSFSADMGTPGMDAFAVARPDGSGTVAIASVTHSTGDDHVDLVLAADLVEGVEYRVTASEDCEDTAGTLIASDGRTADFASPAAVPTINLVSAVPDGPLALILTFDRPPAGTVLDVGSYVLATDGGGYVPAVLSIAFEPAPEGEIYPVAVRLILAAQATGGEEYSVTVAGIEGPSGESLGTAVAVWEAVAVVPQVVSAAAVGYLGVAVLFDASVQGCGTPGAWDLQPAAGGSPLVIDDVLIVGALVRLSLTDQLVPGREYTVTAPAATTDTSSNPVDPAHKTATFTAPSVSGSLAIRAAGGTVKIRMIQATGTGLESVEV